MLSVARSQQAICTTWGGGFFKTFDGAFLKFSSNCSYMFFQDCRSSYEEFNIKISHGANEQFSEILFKIDTDVAQFANGKVSFNNRILTLPFSNNKILIQTYGSGVKLAFRQLEISAYLNDDAFTVVAGDEFRQQLCGLCGNFDGSSSVTTSYTLPDIKQYLIQPKSSGKCTAVVTSSCKDEKIQTFCKETLNGIGSCGLDQGGYAAMCAIEKCQCGSATTCGCAALSAYSRECSLQYKPLLNWRSSQLCPPQDCPGNLEYQECGSTCPPTCANMDPSKCQEACAAGCVCPSGTVLSAINEETCIAPEDCRCNYNGITYDVSDKITIDCNSCTCEAGSWTCTTRLCPKACSLESGAHFNTFDSRSYTFHGVCSYYLAVGDDWSVEVLLKSCPTGLVDRTCLDSIHLKTPMRSLEFKSNGKIISSQMGVSLPYISDSVKVFRKSSMFIQVDTSYGMMMLVQNSPTMQVYIGLIDNVMFRETGLCGNFNGIASDDFMSSQGLVEGTAAAFANSWKVNPDCDDVGNVIRDPCQLNTAVAKQAELRCAILRNSTAFFKDCHYLVDPYSYYSRCKQDACSCPSGQDCITETFLSYALACASKGLIFENWRKATDSQLVECPNGEVYSYNANACNQTCRSLSSVDLACQESGLVAEGCQCAEGLFANDEGMCVPAASCPCYVNGDTLKPGEKVTIADIPCYCREGQLLCSESKKEECTSPMVYVDCITSTYGKACESSCAIQTPLCLGRQCQPGCICPEGLINNGNGDCVKKEECPCQHNGLSYTPGDTIKVDCNKCKCYSGSWNCTELQCDSTCKMYGDGHYTTFDGQRFQFDGNCEYVVAQDFCVSDPKVGTFQIITENIPCGSMSTCSKSIRFLLQNKEIKLADGKYEIHDVSGSASKGSEEVFTVHTVGLYLIVKASNGIKLIWDRRTSLFIIAPPDKENQLCGLCGKYNFDMSDDFTMRDRSLSASALHFGNSWKASDTCSDVTDEASPCEMNPYRKAWSERKCSILKTDVFEACHSQVDHLPFYEACVRDSCACNIGGDCECFCTSVAAYAEACTSAGQCVAWRTPDLCPVFCDYYNSPDSCTWHYRPCGIVNTKTCGNPAGIDLGNFPHLEATSIGSLPTTTETTPVSTTVDKSCRSVNPPRQVGEKWQIDSCTTATCRSGNQVMTEPVVCLNPPMPKCRNPTTMPVKVYDNNGCCYTWKCNCKCQGWGDPHYITFDGVRYTFLEDCTYILVEERVQQHNLTILLDNYQFNRGNPASFVRGLVVNYNGNSVNMSIPATLGRRQNIITVYYNNVLVTPPLSSNGIDITSSGILVKVTIPAIDATISFTGDMFSIYLPYDLFKNNTQGQCGICNNIPNDDCAWRNGTAEPTSCCPSTASSWVIPDVTKPHCPSMFNSSKKQSCTPSTTPPPCKMNMSVMFLNCSKVVSLQEFLFTCEYDLCLVNSSRAGCASIQAAAEKCAQLGYNVDWRNATNGTSPQDCPGDLVYEECGSTCPQTCANPFQPMCQGCVPGCFCPPGSVLNVSNGTTCVLLSECNCTLNGDAYSPGAISQQGCRSCHSGEKAEHHHGTVSSAYQLTLAFTLTTKCGSMNCNTCLTCLNCLQTTPFGITNTHLTLKLIGANWTKPGDNCTLFTCKSALGQASVVETRISCSAAFNINSCQPGTVTTDEYGCCSSCSLQNSSCLPFEETTVKYVPDCQPKNFTRSSCEGTCQTTTM
ncbi:unnamed protein product [Lampetra planeri]